MKKIINSLNRTYWFKVSVAFIICLLFLIFPACQKDEFNPNSPFDKGIMSSSELFNKCKINYIKDVEGNVYKTVRIGNQWWMAENLRATKFSDRTKIPKVTDPTAWAALTTPGYCWYNNDAASYKATYGALYNWYAVSSTTNGGKNVCPKSWHVPTDVEYETMFNYLGVGGGDKLKETGTSHWIYPNTGATNETGFTALPGGERYPFNDLLGVFADIGTLGNWWGETEYNATAAWYFTLYNGGSFIGYGNNDKRMGYSVRCLRNN